MEILFCDECQQRISPADLESGAAVSEGENTYCPACSKKLGKTAGRQTSATVAVKRASSTTGLRRTGARPAQRGPRREPTRGAVPAGGQGKTVVAVIIAGVVGFAVVGGAMIMMKGPKTPPRPKRSRPAVPAPVPEAPPEVPKAPEPEKPDDSPRSLFGTLKQGTQAEKTPREIADERRATTPSPPLPPPPPPPPPSTTAGESYHGPAPVGHAMPANAKVIYKEDFENGRGGWERGARIVDGGPGGSKKCAVTDGKTVSKWMSLYTFTAKTRIRFACYIPAEGGARSFQLMCWDTTAKDNVRVAYRRLERGKWHVFDVGPQDFFRWNTREKPEGHQMKSVGFFPDGNSGKVVFDDVTIYEEPAGGAAAPAPKSYGPVPAPAGYSVPAKAAVKYDFESGDSMGWSSVEVVKGGLGASEFCLRTADDGTERYGKIFKMTSRTVVQLACYLPPERPNGRFTVKAWDKTAEQNMFKYLRGLEKGKWQVIKIRMQDWTCTNANKTEGHDFNALKIWAGKETPVVFDDVVVYEE